jgi:hypothetical protein
VGRERGAKCRIWYQLTGTAQDKAERVAAVCRYEILDTPRDEAFDRVAVLAPPPRAVPLAARPRRSPRVRPGQFGEK